MNQKFISINGMTFGLLRRLSKKISNWAFYEAYELETMECYYLSIIPYKTVTAIRRFEE